MDAPTVADEPMMTLMVTVHRVPVGATPFATRIEIPFEGVATSPHWDGERRVTGVDHLTVSNDGVAAIDVHTVVTGDDETIIYRGHGRSGGPNGLREGVTFETPCERLSWLNHTVAVGTGDLDGDQLTIRLYAIT